MFSHFGPYDAICSSILGPSTKIMERINGSSGNYLLPKNLILQVKFSIKPHTACQKKKESENWLDIDNNAEVVATKCRKYVKLLPMMNPD